MPFDSSKIPAWLRRTPEQQEQDRALQEQLRTAQGPGRRPNPTEAHLIRAAAVKRAAEAELHQLRLDTHPDPRHLIGASARLAEALAMEGRFSEAAEIHPSAAHADRFQQIAEAIERDDADSPCDCEVKQATNPATGQPVALANEIISEMVFSPKHGKLMPLVVCTACGDMNVKPAPQHLLDRIQRVRREHNAARATRRHVSGG
jgi:hypothetical protein